MSICLTVLELKLQVYSQQRVDIALKAMFARAQPGFAESFGATNVAMFTTEGCAAPLVLLKDAVRRWCSVLVQESVHLGNFLVLTN